MPLVGLELEQRPGLGVHRLVARLDTDGSVDDQEKSRLLHAVIAECFAGTQRDEHGPLRAILRVQDDG